MQAKQLRRKKRQLKKIRFAEILGFRYRQFLGMKEPKWSPFYEKPMPTPSKATGMTNKERLLFNRMDNNHKGIKRHGRFQTT